ncbi:MAG TPA: pyridoxal-phosphate dependent enzyme [Vicinamibacteria bacterium]|nr:pyridoxal-phosphate dependent enzyme [Vicinamibacteria bacterium]
MTMLTLDDVRRAQSLVRPHLAPTPLRRSFALRGVNGFLKLECWQPTGSFKVRGALATLTSLTPEERARGIVAASAGNHALGVAFATAALGGNTRAVLFVPESAPRAKVEKLRTFPVTVHEAGRTYDDAYAAAQAYKERTGATYVHAYDDPRTAAGQGTCGLEILEQLEDVGTILVPVGGGGLIAGIATAVKAQRRDVRIVAVQPEASPSFAESLRQGRALLEYDAGPTLADGLAGGIGHMAWDHRGLVDAVVNVPEVETEKAMLALLSEDQVLAEGSGAVGVAALRAGLVSDLGHRPVVAVVTGGNVDARVLKRLLSAEA